MKDMRRKPRWVQRVIATLFGYFWLPCPLCGECFGGQEWREGDCLEVSEFIGKGVCANCGDKARQLNAEMRGKHGGYCFWPNVTGPCLTINL